MRARAATWDAQARLDRLAGRAAAGRIVEGVEIAKTQPGLRWRGNRRGGHDQIVRVDAELANTGALVDAGICAVRR